MITAHYNHPSIYIWGILNECASDTEYGRECYSEQYELIKSLDPYRPRSSASCRFKTDICLGYPEVVSYNIYPNGTMMFLWRIIWMNFISGYRTNRKGRESLS